MEKIKDADKRDIKIEKLLEEWHKLGRLDQLGFFFKGVNADRCWIISSSTLMILIHKMVNSCSLMISKTIQAHDLKQS